MSLALLQMSTVICPPPVEAANTKLGQALDRLASRTGVLSIWVPESRWPFLDLPPQIVWRGEQCRPMVLALLQAHKAANFEPIRAYVGPQTIYVHSKGCQTVGVVLDRRETSTNKSLVRVIGRLLVLAAERS